MRKPAWWLLGVVALGGCKDDQVPGCRIAQSTILPESRLTGLADAVLQRAGDGFLLVGSAGDEVRWAPIAADGTMGTESMLTLPQRGLRSAPWFGAVAKNAPADQLVVVYAAPKGGSASQFQLTAITQMAGAAASAPIPIADLPAGVDPKIVRLAMGTGRGGQRAVLTWGFEGQDAPPLYVVLQADAQPLAPPAALTTSNARWTCLSVIPSLTDAAVSLLQDVPGTPPVWHAYELAETGRRGIDRSFPFDVNPSTCFDAAPNAHGYVIAYQDKDATYLSDFDVEKSIVAEKVVAGVLEFGGAAKQPRIACVAAMGSEFTVLFDRPTGPEVRRIDAFGVSQGSPLFLPSLTGLVGPVSAQSGKDAFYASYLDQGGASKSGPTDGNATGNGRHFVRVDCPLAAPASGPDAGIDAGMTEAGK
jgi:hypothetical protein